MKHGPVGVGQVLYGRELSESARSHSSLRVRQVALVPMRLFGSRSLSEDGLGGPSATPGFLLQCADFAAPTVFPIRAAVLQNSIHTTRVAHTSPFMYATRSSGRSAQPIHRQNGAILQSGIDAACREREETHTSTSMYAPPIVWLKDQDFLVLMKEYRDGRRRLITSYRVDRPHTRRSLQKKYAKRVNKKGQRRPPAQLLPHVVDELVNIVISAGRRSNVHLSAAPICDAEAGVG